MRTLLDRGVTVLAICSRLAAAVPDFKLVKPYEGEIDRYSKKTQVKEPVFPAQVNLATPFALVISKDRRARTENNATKLIHEISIYVGVQNTHNFSALTAPPAFALLNKCVLALHGGKFGGNGAGALTLESDGEYLITTDLFTIYDQRYTQKEIGI